MRFRRRSLNSWTVPDLLGSMPFLQRLPNASFLQIVEDAQLRHFGAGETIIKEDEPGEGLYIIWKGEAETLRKVDNPCNLSNVPAVLRKGDHFGRVLTGSEEQLHSNDIIARSEVTCILIKHEKAHLLSPASTWRHEPGDLSIVERLLQLKFIREDVFRVDPTPEAPVFWSLYGGYMVGLALGAACKTVNPALDVHSLHAYFVLSGISSLPITFKVERIRDGHNVATRHVQAIQREKVCYVMYASFQRAGDGLEYQYPMPKAPPPDELPTYQELLGPLCTDPRLSKYKQEATISCLEMGQSLDLRYVNRRNIYSSEPEEPRQRLWVRTNGKLGDDPALHRSAAGYAFDWSLLETALKPHNKLLNQSPFFGYSIDHSIWFHRPFRTDEYLLFAMDSHRACDSRALCFGRVYTQSGELVASIAQEGRIQLLPPPKVTTPASKL
uniref:Cyclic nucleotide-binding domain-containing protein n=1 Tax=Physcomitrium patens TaxID=3218 RepID=A0A2K1JZN4_PHYPA|nr:uncharacterized protein LOC112287225 isoform X2 [Physcomitrium patens]PNR46979.1 hypothetical protein PHYPA_014099 [Physcomitrium patens]|eukprot:XP_024385795.1 uncharacterized protein LOC112287225 isoform X2 [Physcomitrella patens]